MNHTQMAEAMLVAKKSNPQDVIEDGKRLYLWFSQNIKRFRMRGDYGSNFKSKRMSHGPFGSTHARDMPSVANQTA